MKADLVLKIISQVLGVDSDYLVQVKDTIDLRNCGLSSLKTIQLVVAIESEFDITLDGDDMLIENINTIDKIINLVTRYKQ
jgi:acyl carrier protein